MWRVAAVRVAKRAKGERRLEWLEGRESVGQRSRTVGAVRFNAPKVLGAVRLEDRLPLPAVRRGVMRKEKGGRRPRFEARP